MDDERYRSRLLEIVAAIPNATATPVVDRHIKLEVLERKFGWYMVDHHGDGRIQINAKLPPGYAASLIAEDPVLFFFPSYVGNKGWVGIALDHDRLDWSRIAEVLADSAAYAATLKKPRKKKPAEPTATQPTDTPPKIA